MSLHDLIYGSSRQATTKRAPSFDDDHVPDSGTDEDPSEGFSHQAPASDSAKATATATTARRAPRKRTKGATTPILDHTVEPMKGIAPHLQSNEGMALDDASLDTNDSHDNDNDDREASAAAAEPYVPPRYDLLYAPPASLNNNDTTDTTTTTTATSMPAAASLLDQIPIVYPSGRRRALPSTRKYTPRATEWMEIRHRWKRRKYDLRSEVDWGNAIQTRMAMNAKTTNTTTTSRSAKTKKRGRTEDAMEEDDDETLNLQPSQSNDILSQLQLSQQQQKVPMAGESAKAGVPYAETMSPWEYGTFNGVLSGPAPSLHYKLPPKWSKERERKARQAAKIQGRVYGLQHLPDPIGHQRGAVKHRVFPLETDHTVKSAILIQQRQVLRASALHIMGCTTGQDDNGNDVEERCLAALWKMGRHVPFSTKIDEYLVRPWSQRLLCVDMYSRDVGHAHMAFALTQGRYKDRAAVAKAVGLGELVRPWQIGRIMSGSPQTTTKSLYRLLKAHCVEDDVESPKLRRVGKLTDVPHLEPSVMYLYHPGTIPPTPSFPLDCGQVVFGPMDRYERVHHKDVIDETVYKLTLASLLHRMELFSHNCKTVQLLSKQLLSVLRRIVDVNQNKMYMRIQNQYKLENLEIPLVGFYKSMMQYCSFATSGLALPLQDDDENDVVRAFQWSSPNDLSTITDHLFGVLEAHVKHNGLQLFCRLHLVFGLLRISKMLPSPGIEILSQPLDRQKHQTPFHIMRQLLHFLEEDDILVDGVSSSDDRMTINPGELEYALYRGSITFAKCVEREPTSLEYHSWYLATLCASLLLCSGNRMTDVGAYKYPSEYSGIKAENDLFGTHSERGSTANASHEVRKQLQKFDELRTDTAKAFYAMSHLAKHQNGNRSHLAVWAFLEWRQAVALMLGSEGTQACCQNVCELHRFHKFQWTLLENTEQALQSSRRCSDTSLNERLTLLGCALEQDPNNDSNLRALVNALGPIARKTDRDSDKCYKTSCTECTRTVKGSCIDHDSIAKRRSSDRWWGRDRQSWWYDNLLQLVDSTLLPEPAFIRQKRDIFKRLKECLASLHLADLEISLSDGKHCSTTNSLDWVDNIIRAPEEADRRKNLSVEARQEVIDFYLPKNERFELVLNQVLPQLELTGPNRIFFEGLSMKTVVLCHLCSVTHEGVDRAILHIISEWWKNSAMSTDSDAFRCLCWLQEMGLDIITILHHTTKDLIVDNRRVRVKIIQSVDE